MWASERERGKKERKIDGDSGVCALEGFFLGWLRRGGGLGFGVWGLGFEGVFDAERGSKMFDRHKCITIISAYSSEGENAKGKA